MATLAATHKMSAALVLELLEPTGMPPPHRTVLAPGSLRAKFRDVHSVRPSHWLRSFQRNREDVPFCPADDEPEIFEQPSDLVLKVPFDLDEQGSTDKEGFDR